ncbi:glycosyltransferase family 2 protein [Ruegeria atlantica]|uniref:glycosyltransferase family 2 protein n=1 Tax=Ruegeria atlantica TaxID=81569 RepID=UPI00147B5AD5|nr:glycosyltransferase family A protein [Ruegeria atlantica]
MDASIIIPTYYSWDKLQSCLDCLASQTVGAERFEIIVVNNAPLDPTPEDFRLPSNAQVLTEDKPGSYAARNRGIAAAQAELLFFTDSDCLPVPEYVESGLRIAQDHPDIGRFGGDVVLVPNGPEWTSVELYDYHFGLAQKKWVERGRAVTANLIARRYMFDRIGLFNGEVLSGGDMEWNDRATAAGEPIVFAADAIVRHPARASLREFATKVRRIEGARIRRNARRGALNYVPPIQKLIPSFRIFTKMRKDPDLNFRQALGVWQVQYILRLVMISETVRLLWFKQSDVRK